VNPPARINAIEIFNLGLVAAPRPHRLMANFYRITIDEHDVEDCRDYTSRLDAMVAFKAATRRKSVFSVRVDKCSLRHPEPVRVAQWENGIGDWI